MPRFLAFFPFLILLAAGVSAASAQSAAPVASPGSESAVETTTIELVFDFGDGFQKRYTQLPYRPEMTVLDALEAAQEHPRGIAFEYQGKDATAFVVRVDQVANGGAQGPNWMFQVNGKMAKQSCGVTRLQPGDTVLWRWQRRD